MISSRFPLVAASLAAALLAALLLLVPSSPSNAAAPDAPGEVLTIRGGKLEKFGSPAWKALMVGDPVTLSDRVKTEERALAIFRLPQIGRYVLGPATEIELGKASGGYATEVLKGSVWVHPENLAGNTLTVKTALASTGVRGTMFSVIADGEGMDICTCTGLVDVTPEKGGKLQAPGGTFVKVTPDGTAKAGAISSKMILSRVGDGAKARYDFCFTCHEVGGAVKKEWK